MFIKKRSLSTLSADVVHVANQTFTFLLILLLSLLSILEFLFFTPVKIAFIGISLWYMLWSVFILISIGKTIEIVVTSFKQRSFFTLFVLMFFLALLLFQSRQYTNITFEWPIEIACTLSQIKTEPDFGYFNNCHLGYPTRQFYLPALPSLLFGNSFDSLQTGIFLYTVPAFIFIAHSFNVLFHNSKNRDLLAASALSFLLHFYFANHLLTYIEQAQFPILFGFIVIGLWVDFWKERSINNILLILLFQFILVYSYTPNLALTFFTLLGLIYIGIKNILSKKIVLIYGLFPIIAFVPLFSSIFIRSDIRLTSSIQTLSILLEKIINAFDSIRSVLLYGENHEWSSILGGGISLTGLLLYLSGSRGKKGVVIGLWIIGTILVSIFSHGYSDWSGEQQLFRAAVIIPFLLLCSTEVISKIANKTFLYLFLPITLISGLWYHVNILNTRTDVHQLTLIQFLQNHLPQHQKNDLSLSLSNSINEKIKIDNINDSLSYYQPNWKGQLTSNDTCLYDSDYIVTTPDDACYSYWTTSLTKINTQTLLIDSTPIIINILKTKTVHKNSEL